MGTFQATYVVVEENCEVGVYSLRLELLKFNVKLARKILSRKRERELLLAALSVY